MFNSISCFFESSPHLANIIVRLMDEYSTKFKHSSFEDILQCYQNTDKQLSRFAIALFCCRNYPEKFQSYLWLYQVSSQFSFAFSYPVDILEYYVDTKKFNARIVLEYIRCLFEKTFDWNKIIDVLLKYKEEINKFRYEPLLEYINKFICTIYDEELYRMFFKNDADWLNDWDLRSIIDTMMICKGDFEVQNGIIRNCMNLENVKFRKIAIVKSYFMGNRTESFFKFATSSAVSQNQIKNPLHHIDIGLQYTVFFSLEATKYGFNFQLDNIKELDLIYRTFSTIIGKSPDTFRLASRVLSKRDDIHLLDSVIACYVPEYRSIYLNKDSQITRYVQQQENEHKKCLFPYVMNNGNNIKVALQISGQLRCDTIELLNNVSLLSNMQEMDIYLSVWDRADYFAGGRKAKTVDPNRIFGEDFVGKYLQNTSSFGSKVFFNQLFPKTADMIQTISFTKMLDENDFKIGTFNNISIVCESDFDENYKSIFLKQLNSAKMYYMIYNAHNLSKMNGNEYDVVIRIRPDLQIYYPDLREIIEAAYREPTSLFVSYFVGRGCADQFFVCSKYAMDVVADFWDKCALCGSFRYQDFFPTPMRVIGGEFALGCHVAFSGLKVKVVLPKFSKFTSYVCANYPTLDLTEPLLADLANQPNQEGRLFVEKYIENKNNGIVFK